MNIRYPFVAAALLLLIQGSALGQARQFRIEAGAASTTLNEFSKQAQLQVLFDSDAVRDLKTRAVDGPLDPAQALVRMLGGTDFVFEFVNPRTVAVRRRGPTVPDSPPAGQTTPDGGLRLVQADRATTEKSEVGNAQESRNDTSKGVPEILVKGRRTLNADIERTEDAPQPYVVFDREEIGRSQAESLEEFLRMRLPMNTSSGKAGQTEQFTGSPAAYSSINLRGLGENQTLVLVDGRRMPGLASIGNPRQPDINGIPLSAVERIEVLPSTAGGIYGGSATGGVINIVLRRDFSGMQARANYMNTFDSDTGALRLELSGGLDLREGRTNIMFAAARAESNTLLIRDRDFSRRAVALQLANNPAAITGSTTPPLGRTVNILSASVIGGVRQPLTLKNAYGGRPLGSTLTHVPLGYAGPASDQGAGLIAGAGRYNLDIPAGVAGEERGLAPAPGMESASVNLRHQFTAGLEVFLDAAMRTTLGESRFGSPTTSVANVPVSNPFNPFNQPINVRFPIPGLSFAANSEAGTLRAAGGLIFKLPGEWTGQAEFGWGRSRLKQENTTTVLTTAGNTALRTGLPGPNGAPALNVLQEGNTFPLNLTAYLLPENNTILGPFDTVLKNATARFSGPTLRLPAGPVVLSALIERREETLLDAFQTVPNPTTGGSGFIPFPESSQDVDSVYLEARAPLVDAARGMRWVRELELQLSARHDAYTTRAGSGLYSKLDSTDYTIGLRYAPTETVVMRASFGTGFLPPSVTQITPDVQEFTFPDIGTPFSFGADSQRGGEDMVVDQTFQWIQGGNAALRPERSKSWSAGMILTPRFAPGLRLSVDYTLIDKVDEIRTPDPQLMLSRPEFFPGRIERGPNLPTDPAGWAGVIRVLDMSLMNIAGTTVEAVDIQADYTLDRGALGAFRFYALATWMPRFESQAVDFAPVIDSVGYDLAPLKRRGNLGVDWERGPLKLSWNAQYYDSYRSYTASATAAAVQLAIRNQGSGTIPSQLYHDLLASYRFGAGGSTEVSFGIRNVFDSEPPILAATSPSSAGYSLYGDPRMRRYSLSLRRDF